MPIISVEMMKAIDEREMQKTTKEKQTKTERSKENRSYSEKASLICNQTMLRWIVDVLKYEIFSPL